MRARPRKRSRKATRHVRHVHRVNHRAALAAQGGSAGGSVRSLRTPDSGGGGGGGDSEAPEGDDDDDDDDTAEGDSLEGVHMFGFIKKIAKGVSGGVKLIGKIPGVKFAAVLIPGGAPALAAVGAADTVLSGVNSKHPQKRATAINVVKTTEALAKAGNVQAANGLTMIGKRAAALRAAKLHRVHPVTGVVRKVGK